MPRFLKNIFKSGFFLLFLLAGLTKVSAQEKLNIYLFYSESCPHCKNEIIYLSELQKKYPDIQINLAEISKNRDNAMLFMEVGSYLDTDINAVPFLLIGRETIVGYMSEETTGVMIENQIKKALEEPPEDVVQTIINSFDAQDSPDTQEIIDNDPVVEPEDYKDEYNYILSLPIIGKINTRGLSLPVLTFVIALLDGFNPCAMWVLLFLISLLLGMKDRKRMWILGSAFIIASGFVYFLFMAAWLNFFLFIGYSTIVRYIIGIFAAGIGAYYLRDYFKNKDGGCESAENEKRQKVFARIKNIIQQNQLIVSIFGIILLAFAVNVVELLCSAGLPAVYTNILTLTPLSKVQYYLYLLFYMVIFMIDDLFVFVIAMITLKTVGIENKYGRFSHLVGGILMLVIGLILLLKPELLMFS